MVSSNDEIFFLPIFFFRVHKQVLKIFGCYPPDFYENMKFITGKNKQSSDGHEAKDAKKGVHKGEKTEIKEDKTNVNYEDKTNDNDEDKANAN